MFLKTIEVQGFKSFANKLTFEFHKGITGIVGPNGSGKSNVADAVRWVLGEQSAKQLRGSKMEDVIFSGTENRKPLGFAYVAITLDNSDHQLAIEYDTVTVSRRVYRSGESEYKINNHTCRLKDIQELFFDTGIGKEGYSIIGQGQIDRILSGKPEERRELFDEAAGIVKYKKRKALTVKNLEAEQQNLSRIKDILHELERQVAPLEKQSETARLFLKYREQLKQYDANMYLVSFEQIKAESAKVEENLTIVTDQLTKAQEEYETIKSSYADMEALLETYDQKISVTQESYNAKAIEKQKLEGDMALSETNCKNIAENISQLETALVQTNTKIVEKCAERDALITETTELKEKIDSLSLHKDSSEQTLADMTASVSSFREQIESQNADIIEYLGETANLKGKLQRYEAMKEQAQIHQAELNQRLIALQDEQSSEGELVSAFEHEAQTIADEMDAAKRQFEQLQKQAVHIAGGLQQSRDQLTQTERQYHETSSRYKTLRGITERYDGYGTSIRKVMEKKHENSGIIGVVADIIHVERTYETAIETALGGSISNIVTDNEQTAKNMIQFLKQNRFGRATFLPLTSIKGKKADKVEAISHEKGVIGLASDLVGTDTKFRSLIEYLLGRVFVVDHIDNALALAKKYRYSLRIVTLEGESLNPGGSLSGGAYKNTSNLIGRNREMEELQKKVEQLKKDGETLKTDIDRLQAEKDSNKQAMEKNAAAHTKLTLRENTVQIRLKQVVSSEQAHSKSIGEITREMHELKKQLTDIHELCADLNSQIAEWEEKIKTAEAEIESLNTQLLSASEQEKLFNEQTADVRINYANYIQKQQFLSENMTRILGELRTLQQTDADASEQLKQLHLDNETAQSALAALQTQMAALEEEMVLMRNDLQKEMDDRSAYTATHKQFFTKREEISETIQALDREQFRLTNQKEKLDESRNSLSGYMWEEYGLTYHTAQESASDELRDTPLSTLKKMIVEVKQLIKQLGPVNVNAIDEYKEVHERYETLKTQHDDMVQAEAKLSGIIDSLNTSMERQFKEKFALIQKEFDEIFKLLFGGGKGTLELSDPENLLETGVSITAQPPGKKLQNMMQLSGGEKALTAIALLFAIQGLKPSPFCLLDEIEAALDDANVKRFAEYLHNLTAHTQFIVITHRRGTMNAADVLYGITMQEKGVSTLVSVSLIENDLEQEVH